MVVVLQNGVDHVERVAPLAAGATVLRALAYVAAERVARGRVVHRRGRRIVLPAGPPARALAELLKGSWLNLVEEPDFRTAAWRKIFSNVAANPVTALTGRRMGVLRDAEIRELARVMLAEAVAAGIVEGARLGPEDVAGTMAFYDGFGEDDGTSMLYDRLAGRELENELLSGAITSARPAPWRAHAGQPGDVRAGRGAGPGRGSPLSEAPLGLPCFVGADSYSVVITERVR